MKALDTFRSRTKEVVYREYDTMRCLKAEFINTHRYRYVILYY